MAELPHLVSVVIAFHQVGLVGDAFFIHDLPVIEGRLDAPWILGADGQVDVKGQGLLRLDGQVVKDRCTPEGAGIEACGDDSRCRGKTSDECYFGLPFEAGCEGFRPSLGHAGDCGVAPADLHGVAGLDEGHEHEGQVVDALVIAGAQLGVGEVVFAFQFVGVHVGADDDHGNREAFAEHIAVEGLQDGLLMDVGVVAAAAEVSEAEAPAAEASAVPAAEAPEAQEVIRSVTGRTNCSIRRADFRFISVFLLGRLLS